VIAELTDRLFFLHILAAIVWLAGLVTLGLLATLVLWDMVFKPGL
jgi:hypothetical protein